jgi:hypothetical protein
MAMMVGGRYGWWLMIRREGENGHDAMSNRIVKRIRLWESSLHGRGLV